MSKGLDWDDLQFFLAVARTGTVSQASRRMGVDHATVTRRLDNLEKTLGAKLFERNPRGYNLTKRGEGLLVSAHGMVGGVQTRERGTAAGELAISGVVRISSLEGFANFFLAARLPLFAAAHPNVSIEMIAIQQIVALSRREVDIAITLQPPETLG